MFDLRIPAVSPPGDTEEVRGEVGRDAMAIGQCVFTNRVGLKGSVLDDSWIGLGIERGLAERVTVHGSGPCPFTRAAFRLGQK